MIQKNDTSVKDSLNTKNHAQNMDKIWNPMKRQNIQLIGIEEVEETHVKHIFKKVVRKK